MVRFLDCLALNRTRSSSKFKAFGWYISGSTSLNTVFLNCKVLACPPEDTSACDINCSGSRQKRALGSLETLSNDEGVNSKVRTGFVSSEPIVVVRRDISDSEHNALTGPSSQYSPLTASLASVFTLAAFVTLVVAIGLFVVKQRNISAGRQYYLLHSNHAD
ncbi:uncharacterized protein LOC142344744 [Convolutriloba macropyga]|uniref:uncharacterized protein LOC142344744 n=1 Tax=Convolutriloba macropyga TaxID=536237 RepID=UPI003F52380D